MKIIYLETTNIKKIKAIECRLKDDDSCIVVGGDNGQGKSSLLDSIYYALAGKSVQPGSPIRHGMGSASVICDLGEFTVERKITRTGGSLKIRGKDGEPIKSPQTFLNRLMGKICFDPLSFYSKSKEEQSKYLQEILGLDLSSYDRQYDLFYDERYALHKEMRTLEEQLKQYPEEFEELSDSDEILRRLQNIREQELLMGRLKYAKDDLIRLDEQIKSLLREYDVRKKEVVYLESQVSAIKESGETKESLQAKLEENRRKQQHNDRVHFGLELKEKLEELQRGKRDLEKKMQQVKEAKRQKISETKFPIEGLSFEDGSILLNGIPLDQCCTSEQLRVAVAIGLALNKEIRVLLIREGSLLDEKHLRMLRDLASEYDAQIWIERVSKGDEVTLLIEDGELVE